MQCILSEIMPNAFIYLSRENQAFMSQRILFYSFLCFIGIFSYTFSYTLFYYYSIFLFLQVFACCLVNLLFLWFGVNANKTLRLSILHKCLPAAQGALCACRALIIRQEVLKFINSNLTQRKICNEWLEII